MKYPQLISKVKELPRESLEHLAIVTYGMLFLDEDGEYSPEDSMAAGSAADLVDAISEEMAKMLGEESKGQQYINQSTGELEEL